MATRDDERQAQTALAALASAEAIIVPLPCALELVWVLDSIYRFSPSQIAEALVVLISSDKVVADTAAIEAGIRVKSAGGDFADGVIAAAGVAMGSEMFVSFDRKAIARISELGIPARHPASFP